MKIGIAADHAGFEMKNKLLPFIESLGFVVKDYGAYEMNKGDDYPDLIIPLAKGLVNGEVDRAIAVCGSGVGASVVANKIAGVRAALINDIFSAHQGVEDDDMNMLCLGGRITGEMVAQEFIKAFLNAKFSNEERHARRLGKVIGLEKNWNTDETD